MRSPKLIACIMLIFSIFNFGPFAHLALGQHNDPQTANTQPSEQESIRMETTVVTVHTTVLDSNQRYVKGLTKENFKIFEGNVEQEIKYFDNGVIPRSIGIVLDVSGSMTSEKIEQAKKAMEVFKRYLGEKDEFFIVLFGKQVYRISDFTKDIGSAVNVLAVKPGGGTALYDAVYEASEYLVHNAHNPRRVLVLISDGQDNASRRSFGEIKKLIREYDMLLYTFLTPAHDDPFYRQGYAIMQELAELTGARMFDSGDMEENFSTLALETSAQYTLGYEVDSPKHDGKWHQIKVKVVSALAKHLHIRFKSGYVDRK